MAAIRSGFHGGLLAATLSALGLLGCDSGGGSPTAPAPPVARGINFSAQQATDGSIALRGASSGETLEVEVYAAGVQDLYGLNFELLFPASLLRYEDRTGGVFPSLHTHESEPGRLLVGATHLGAVSGLSGGGTVTVARFSVIANGSGRFDFSGQEAFDSFGDRVALEWLGGAVQVDL